MSGIGTQPWLPLVKAEGAQGDFGTKGDSQTRGGGEGFVPCDCCWVRVGAGSPDGHQPIEVGPDEGEHPSNLA